MLVSGCPALAVGLLRLPDRINTFIKAEVNKALNSRKLHLLPMMLCLAEAVDSSIVSPILNDVLQSILTEVQSLMEKLRIQLGPSETPKKSLTEQFDGDTDVCSDGLTVRLKFTRLLYFALLLVSRYAPEKLNLALRGTYTKSVPEDLVPRLVFFLWFLKVRDMAALSNSNANVPPSWSTRFLAFREILDPKGVQEFILATFKKCPYYR